MDAKSRFEATRAAVPRLNEVKALIMYGCDDWRPEGVRTPVATSDPTAAAAIRAVDELADKLDALKSEEAELEDLIGTSLAIIEAVWVGLGEIYANLLDWYYIDCRTWTQISEDNEIKRSTCYYLVDIAFDWIDSVGVSRLLKGEVDV